LRQAETSAASDLLGGKKRLENPVDLVFLGGVIFRRSAGGDMLMRFLIRPTAPPS
jgi:hypothetical protein